MAHPRATARRFPWRYRRRRASSPPSDRYPLADFYHKIIYEHWKARSHEGASIGIFLDNGKEEMDLVDVLLSLPGENGKDHMDDM